MRRFPLFLAVLTSLSSVGAAAPDHAAFQVRVSTQSLVVGQPLVVSFDLDAVRSAGAIEKVSLVSRGQRVREDADIPLSENDQVLATSASGSELRLDTFLWRPQVLNCLVVEATVRGNGGGAPTTAIAQVPKIVVRPKTGSLDPALMPSYRGERLIHLLTHSPFMNTFEYPTCQSWRNDHEVFFESDEPRPDGRAVRGERQLVMKDILTGRETWLATLAVEDVRPYGTRHVNSSSMYHADYSRAADLLVYIDMTSHRMYTLHPGGKPTEVLHMTSGRIGDPPAISRDGKRLVYYVVLPGPAQDADFQGETSAIYTLKIDPVSGQALQQPHLVYAYPWRRLPDRPNFPYKIYVAVNHVQFNPVDDTKIMYAHEGYFDRDGKPEDTRIWHMNDDGTDNHPLAPQEEIGHFYSHELYGPQGRYIYTFWDGSIARIEVATNRFERIYQEQKPMRDVHVGVSADEKWVAGDIISGLGEDNDGNPIGGLFLVNVATGKPTFLASFPSGLSHPRHIHPNFSPDGTKVGFTIADGKKNAQIAYIDVSDITGR